MRLIDNWQQRGGEGKISFNPIFPGPARYGATTPSSIIPKQKYPSLAQLRCPQYRLSSEWGDIAGFQCHAIQNRSK